MSSAGRRCTARGRPTERRAARSRASRCTSSASCCSPRAAGCSSCGVVELLDGGTKPIVAARPGHRVRRSPACCSGGGRSSPLRIPSATIFGAILAGVGRRSAIAGALPYVLSGVARPVRSRVVRSRVRVHDDGVDGAPARRSPSRAGILLWRATTQWFGGVAITVFVVSVLPYVPVGRVRAPRGDLPQLGGRAHGVAHPGDGEAHRPRLRRVHAARRRALRAVRHGDVRRRRARVHDGVDGWLLDARPSRSRSSTPPGVEWTAIAAMVLAGGNFALYWQALRGKPLKLFRSVELRAYLIIVALVAVAAVAWNDGERCRPRTTSAGRSSAPSRSRRRPATRSSTTTQWAGAVQLVLLFAMVVGGMPGGVGRRVQDVPAARRRRARAPPPVPPAAPARRAARPRSRRRGHLRHRSSRGSSGSSRCSWPSARSRRSSSPRSADTTCRRRSRSSRRRSATSARPSGRSTPLRRSRRRRPGRPDGRDARRTARDLSRAARARPGVPVHRRPAPADGRARVRAPRPRLTRRPAG